jgi:hypothetical protein
VAEGDLVAVDADRALVRRMDAREHLHQRGLAGAVLSDDGVDLTRPEVEVHAVEHLHADEALADSLHLQQVRHRSSSLPPRTRSQHR